MAHSINNITKSRLVWIDAIKGIGIILIMMSHSCSFPIYTGLFAAAGFVAIYFVISGFTYKDMPFRQLILKKSKTLLIPYFFYGALSVIAVSLYDGYIGVESPISGFNFTGLLYSRYSLYHIEVKDNVFFLTGGLEPLWFMTCMFLSFVWVGLYFKITRGGGRLLLLLAYTLLSYGLTQLPWLLPWSIDTSFVGAVLIIAGYHANKRYDILKTRKLLTIPIFLISGLAFAVLAYLFGQDNMSLGIYSKYGLFGMIGFLSVAFLRTLLFVDFTKRFEQTFFMKFFAKVGRQSLRLMCIHLAVFVFFGLDCSRGIHNYPLSFLAIFTSIALAYIFSYISCKGSKYIPIFKYI